MIDEPDDTSIIAIDEERLTAAIRSAQEWLLENQFKEGYWWGELEANVSITAEYLLLTHFLGISDASQWEKISRYLRNHQQPEGFWAQWYGGPGELNTTIEAYFALKLAGEDPDAAHMRRAREWILANGGIAETRIFTKLWLALFDQFDWEQLPAMPVWINLLPKWFTFNVYEFASWARATIVGITIVFSLRQSVTLPAGAGVQELWVDPLQRKEFCLKRPKKLLSWQSLFFYIDKALRFMDRNHIRPFQRRSLATAERWLLDRQEADGSWGGIQPPWVYAILALRGLGYQLDHPVMENAIKGFKGFTREENNMLWTEPCVSPVWDTGLAAIALLDSGLPSNHTALQAAGDWLLRNQISTGGDWQIKNPDTPPGGWAFEFDNSTYPDIDDSAIVMMAIEQIEFSDPVSKRRALDQGLRWILSMQSQNGGWGSFDLNNTTEFITCIPFADFGETIDPPTADVTAHVLELLGILGYHGNFPPAESGLKFLEELQEPDGSWWGRWGINYIYGIGAALPAIAKLGNPVSQNTTENAVRWLRHHQLSDGGWGEGSETYDDPNLKGAGPSTPSQTAWALMGLIAAGETDSPETLRGIKFLLDRQLQDGTWNEPQFTATGFPTDFMLKYHLYRNYFPLIALGRFRMARNHDS